jgi:hypothetical protein
MASLVAERIQKSVTVLANATELAAAIIVRISGNEVANTINGALVSRQTARTMIQSRFEKNLQKAAKA